METRLPGRYNYEALCSGVLSRGPASCFAVSTLTLSGWPDIPFLLSFARGPQRRGPRLFSAMLVLHRKVGEAILIDGRIKIVLVEVAGRTGARLGIEAPPEVRVLRGEVAERLKV